VNDELRAVRAVDRGEADAPAPSPDHRRLRGERGSGMVTALVLLFAFTAGGVVWLARDVNRRVTNQSAAQSIAFQAARSGAQQISLGSLRDEGSDGIVIDLVRAQDQATGVAQRLFVEYGVVGNVDDVRVDGEVVTVTVTISDPAGDVVGVGAAEPETGP
jgi:hypothetical protein